MARKYDDGNRHRREGNEQETEGGAGRLGRQRKDFDAMDAIIRRAEIAEQERKEEEEEREKAAEKKMNKNRRRGEQEANMKRRRGTIRGEVEEQG